MFMVLSSWQSHFEHSSGSSDECSKVPIKTLLIMWAAKVSSTSDHLVLGPVPRCVEMRFSLQMSKLDFVRSRLTDDTDWEFHLQKLVAFMPVNLQIHNTTKSLSQPQRLKDKTVLVNLKCIRVSMDNEFHYILYKNKYNTVLQQLTLTYNVEWLQNKQFIRYWLSKV